MAVTAKLVKAEYRMGSVEAVIEFNDGTGGALIHKPYTFYNGETTPQMLAVIKQDAATIQRSVDQVVGLQAYIGKNIPLG